MFKRKIIKTTITINGESEELTARNSIKFHTNGFLKDRKSYPPNRWFLNF